MPSYTFRDKKTDETWDDMMTIAEMEDYLKKNNIESYKEVISKLNLRK